MLRRHTPPAHHARPAHAAPERRAPRAPWGWALAGLLTGLLLVALLAAPARWLASALAQASAGQWLLQDARGTLWDGSAQLVLTGGAGSQDSAALPERLHWQLRPHPRGLRLQLRAACCTPHPLALQLQPGWGQWQLQLADGLSQWPAALLTGLGTPWNTLQPQGQLQIQTQGLQLHWAQGRLQLQGRVQLDALALSSRLSTLRPMGSYRLTLQGGDSPQLELVTLDGALQLSGSGQWVGQRLRFRGEASAAPGREAAMANLLNIIGRRSGPRSVITLG